MPERSALCGGCQDEGIFTHPQLPDDLVPLQQNEKSRPEKLKLRAACFK